jgi:Fe-Mn family superoxide dismutase
MKPLPYDYDALEPHIGVRTLQFHYDKHHHGYMKKLKAAIEDTPQQDQTLERIVLESEGDVFNNAAQLWNHDFYWESLTPNGGGRPGQILADAIKDRFGDFDSFQKRLKKAATGQFGSGWAWLVVGTDGKLQVMSTPDAENPQRSGLTPLLTIDVWEHAYYLDYQNERDTYVDRVLGHLINWKFAEDNFQSARQRESAERKAG